MALTRVSRIDGLVSGAAGIPPIGPGDSDRAAVGIVQDLLRTQGFTRLPDPRAGSYGNFGDLTRQAVLAYRANAGLGTDPQVDGGLLADLARRPAAQPAASRGYLALVLDHDWNDLLAVVALTSLFESAGRFDCLNLNTDRAGLSFGIIQWAQKPGRLHELLDGFQSRQPAAFAGAAVDPAGLLAHTARPQGGVDDSGRTVDPGFDLVADPWKGRFLAMGRGRELQEVQVDMAITAFRASLAQVRAQAPRVVSARGCAFMLDLANQHGDGGAHSIYDSVAPPPATEADLLAAMERESIRRVTAKFGPGSPEAVSTANRRAFFRATPLLSDSEAAFA